MTDHFDALRQRVDAALDEALTFERLRGRDGDPPERLVEAMRYAVLGGGKRMRPVLALAACEAVGGDLDAALPFACALECVHAYSLVHDDLPCMDDDDERRGRPTVHIAYGQATAVLVGDALLTAAFGMLTHGPGEPTLKLELVALLAEAAGAAGMVGGQELDMAAASTPPSLTTVRMLHAMKTGALFRAAVLGGGIAAGATPEARETLNMYGVALGRAFQVTDDILELPPGHATSGDAHEDNVSLAVRLGVEEAREEAGALVKTATEAAASFGDHGDTLRAIADRIATRKH